MKVLLLFCFFAPRHRAGSSSFYPGQVAARGAVPRLIIGSAASGTLLLSDHWRLCAASASLRLSVAGHGGAAAAARSGASTSQRGRLARGEGGRRCPGAGEEEEEKEEEE